MFARIASISLLLFILASSHGARDSKWSYKNVIEPNCRNCKCFNSMPTMELAQVELLLRQKRNMLMGSRYLFTAISARKNNKLIESDSELGTFSQTVMQSTMTGKKKMKTVREWKGTEIVEMVLCKTKGDTIFCKSESVQCNQIRSKNVKSDMKPTALVSVLGSCSWTTRIVWADEHHLLLVFCGGLQSQSSWTLTSTKTTLSKKIKMRVFKILKEAGFDLSKTVINPRK